MTTEIQETEQKYEAAPGAVLPPLDGLPHVARVSGPEAQTLTAEYFDTPDFRLIRAGVTLRRRQGGADEGWHLKLPDSEQAGTGAVTRRELRLPLTEPGDPVPSELAHLVLVHTRNTPLGPVARIETRRRRTTLHDNAGASLAEVVADEISAQSLGTSTAVSRWDEFEVELTGGNSKLLRAADKRLRDAGLRPAGRSTKLERSLPVTLPAPRSHGRLTAGSTAGEVVLGYLAVQTARLMSLDPAVRQDEPDAIHQMRVTTRRLRSTLQAYQAILPADATRHLSDELKRLGRVLGDARDGEVLSEYLRTGLASTPTELVMGPAQASIRAHFAPREAAARAAVLEALDSPAYLAMLDELDGLLDDPPLTSRAARPAGQVLPDALAQSYRRVRRRMRRALRAPAGPARDTALHEARKAAKRARYAAEAARPASGKKARRLAKAMKAVQSVLGDHQDAVNARAVARELGVHANLAGDSAFSFGLLHERANQDAQEQQKRAERVWKRAAHGKALSWLT
jgi:CHAD domain-containing protein